MTTSKTKVKALIALDALRSRIDDAKRDFLTAYGWERTSDNPAHIWLYTKTIDGVVYALDADSAIMVEERI